MQGKTSSLLFLYQIVCDMRDQQNKNCSPNRKPNEPLIKTEIPEDVEEEETGEEEEEEEGDKEGLATNTMIQYLAISICKKISITSY